MPEKNKTKQIYEDIEVLEFAFTEYFWLAPHSNFSNTCY